MLCHDFRHTVPAFAEPYNASMPVVFWLRAAAYLTWLVCALPGVVLLIDGQLSTWRALVGGVAFITFGLAFTLNERGRGIVTQRGAQIALLAVGAVSALVLVSVLQNGLPSALLVVTAACLPHVMGARAVGAWLAVQSLALGALFWWMGGPLTAIASGGAFVGFQLFAVSAAWLAHSEGRARQDLARANAELMATRELLAENSRVSERLRIARDLHDTLGHHLTALSIQLEVASRLTEGARAEHIREAHAVARLLLGDVRNVVSSLRASGRIDLSQALRALTVTRGLLAIHLDAPERLDLEDSAQAHALLRCVQEIITNTARHASARNLWISIAQRPDGIALHARDDGRGAPELTWGNGLRGMRERFEEYAGRVEVRSRAGAGFEVHGFMPRPEAA